MHTLKILAIGFILLKSINLNAQAIYVDPTTTGALAIYAFQIENAHERHIEEQTRLQRAQTWVGIQMERVKTVQNKVYRGLSEVSGTVSNGLQVMRIYHNFEVCENYAGRITNLAREHPQFTVFAARATQKAYQQIVEAGTEVSSILTSGELNLATAGDRIRILETIEDKSRVLRINLMGILMKLERAERLGFWGAINPFQTYINTDKDIIQNTLERWDRF